ncbi:MAG: hypothetical protein WB773_09970 [Isosphaeraceae bacterium]|jgi:hypothetical protein
MTTTKYGYKAEDWEAAKEEMRQILVERACLRGMIPYSDLVSRIEAIRMEPDSFALAHMLGEISQEEDAAGRGMLSVIVVHKVGDMQPGPGFFQLAKKNWGETRPTRRPAGSRNWTGCMGTGAASAEERVGRWRPVRVITWVCVPRAGEIPGATALSGCRSRSRLLPPYGVNPILGQSAPPLPLMTFAWLREG